MYSIGEAAKQTGLTAFTLRYYEKAGVLPKPSRAAGARQYTPEDVRYIQFIHGLKQTGMSLEEIAAFTESGCLLSLQDASVDTNELLRKRMAFLDRHMERLDQQIAELERLKAASLEKRTFYEAWLRGEGKREENIRTERTP